MAQTDPNLIAKSPFVAFDYNPYDTIIFSHPFWHGQNARAVHRQTNNGIQHRGALSTQKVRHMSFQYDNRTTPMRITDSMLFAPHHRHRSRRLHVDSMPKQFNSRTPQTSWIQRVQNLAQRCSLTLSVWFSNIHANARLHCPTFIQQSVQRWTLLSEWVAKT